MLPGLATDLTGMRYTQTITVSADPSGYGGTDKNADYSLMVGNVAGFTDTITLDGHVFTFNLGLGQGYQELAMGATNHSASNPYDTVFTQETGDDIGNPVRVGIVATATDFGFVPSLDFQQPIYFGQAGTLQGSSNFQWLSSGGAQLVWITGSLDVLVVNNGEPSTNVPEPASILLMGLGSAALGALRRRKRSDSGNNAV
jgi:hypothetical protein